MVIDGFERLAEDAAVTGRLLVLNLHPFVIGQPARIKYLRHVLEDLRGRDGVWFATGNEIATWYRDQMMVNDGPAVELPSHG